MTYSVECKLAVNAVSYGVQLEIEHGEEQSHKTKNGAGGWSWEIFLSNPKFSDRPQKKRQVPRFP
jgi:hypothetical protein